MRISEDTKSEIICLLQDGHTGKEISEMIGVSQVTVSRIRQKLDSELLKQDKKFPEDLIQEWEALNRIGREYQEKKSRKENRE